MPWDDAGGARIRDAGRADLLVGIPTYRNASTVRHVLRAVEVGLRKYYPDRRCVIVVSDGGSDDGTREVAVAPALTEAEADRYLVDPRAPVPERILLTYGGPSGKGSAFRAIFEAADALEPQACAVFDADLRSVAPEWVDRLIAPVLLGHDHVTPVYTRHKFDGTITNSIAFPLTAALYGRRLRQPIGGDFGFSTEIARAWAAADVWSTDVARFGVDIWMTTFALVAGASVCQAHLGAKIHDPKDPGADLGPMFRQVVGSLFALAAEHAHGWIEVDEVVDVATYGFPTTSTAEDVVASADGLAARFAAAATWLRPMWRRMLTPDVHQSVCAAAERAAAGDTDLVPGELWVRVVYDCLVAFSRNDVENGDLLDAMVPLYFARTSSFVREHARSDADAAEAAVLEYVELFLRDKDYLRAQWFTGGLRRHLDEQSVRPAEARASRDPAGRDPV